MGNFDEGRAIGLHCCGNYRGNIFWCADTGGKAREWTDDFKLLWRLMESATGLSQNGRSHIRADQDERGIGLKAFQQSCQREEIARPGGGKNYGGLSAAAAETVCGKGCGLLVAGNPVLEAGALTQRVIQSNVVDAGNTKPGIDAMGKQSVHQGGCDVHTACG